MPESYNYLMCNIGTENIHLMRMGDIHTLNRVLLLALYLSKVTRCDSFTNLAYEKQINEHARELAIFPFTVLLVVTSHKYQPFS
jgi:hypothetical protein